MPIQKTIARAKSALFHYGYKYSYLSAFIIVPIIFWVLATGMNVVNIYKNQKLALLELGVKASQGIKVKVPTQSEIDGLSFWEVLKKSNEAGVFMPIVSNQIIFNKEESTNENAQYTAYCQFVAFCSYKIPATSAKEVTIITKVWNDSMIQLTGEENSNTQLVLRASPKWGKNESKEAGQVKEVVVGGHTILSKYSGPYLLDLERKTTVCQKAKSNTSGARVGGECTEEKQVQKITVSSSQAFGGILAYFLLAIMSFVGAMILKEMKKIKKSKQETNNEEKKISPKTKLAKEISKIDYKKPHTFISFDMALTNEVTREIVKNKNGFIKRYFLSEKVMNNYDWGTIIKNKINTLNKLHSIFENEYEEEQSAGYNDLGAALFKEAWLNAKLEDYTQVIEHLQSGQYDLMALNKEITKTIAFNSSNDWSSGEFKLYIGKNFNNDEMKTKLKILCQSDLPFVNSIDSICRFLETNRKVNFLELGEYLEIILEHTQASTIRTLFKTKRYIDLNVSTNVETKLLAFCEKKMIISSLGLGNVNMGGDGEKAGQAKQHLKANARNGINISPQADKEAITHLASIYGEKSRVNKI